MDCRRSSYHRVVALMIAGLWGIVSPSQSWSLDVAQPISQERHEAVSLADAAVRALQNNLDISLSRHTKESRLTDIVIEQAKFDPTLSVNGRYLRTVDPLERPVLGATGNELTKTRSSTSATIPCRSMLRPTS